MGSAWLSGINLYATVLALGLLQRFHVAHLPGDLSYLSHTWVLIAAGALYAIELGWPKGGEAIIHALASNVGTREVASVALLGSARPLTFEQKPDGLHVHVPAGPIGQYAYAYRITWR